MQIVDVRRGPDDGMLFTAQREDRTGLWRIAAANAQPELLLPEMAPDVRRFAVSPDAQTVVYEAAGTDGIPHLWSLPVRGGSPRLLTEGGGEFAPAVCPGGTPVLYRRHDAEGLWAIDGPGRSPRQVTELLPYSSAPVCSPDGERIAFDTNLPVGELFQRTLVVVPAAGGNTTHRIPWPDGKLLAWDPGAGNRLSCC